MNKLREFRKHTGLTQKQLAEKLGISESYYSQIENNKRRLSLRTALNITTILELMPSDIFLLDNFALRQE